MLRSNLKSLLVVFLLPSLAWADPSGTLLYSKMGSANDIYSPVVAASQMPSLAEAVPGAASGEVSFEPGVDGMAVRFDGEGSVPPALAVFHGDNFDFEDSEGDGGMMHFWLKFNDGPHPFPGNHWIMRTDWNRDGPWLRSDRWFVFEPMGGNQGILVAFYSVLGSPRSQYGTSSVNPYSGPLWNEQVQQNQWHSYTLLWRNNGPDKGEMHLFIDGTQEGCNFCSDYNINLPKKERFTKLFLSHFLARDGQPEQMMSFSMDEFYSADTWDYEMPDDWPVTKPSARFPEGVRLTYPRPHRYPQWGQIVRRAVPSLEFVPVNYQKEIFSCDVYVNSKLQGTVATSDNKFTSLSAVDSLETGVHTYQVKCDAERVSSPLWTFRVEVPGHCADGILNGDETAVDCGGSCKVCSGDRLAPAAPANLRRL